MTDNYLKEIVKKLVNHIKKSDNEYELFLRILSCKSSIKGIISEEYIIKRIISNINEKNMGINIKNLILKLRKLLSNDSFISILLFFNKFIDISTIFIDIQSNLKQLSLPVNFSRNTLIDSGSRNLRVNNIENNDIMVNAEICVNEDNCKIFDTNKMNNNEGKGFISKDVINKLSLNYQTSPWLLINDKLNEGSREKDLLLELIYVMQGIEGLYIIYNSNLDKYTINPNCIIPSTIKTLIFRICEMGYLYRNLYNFITTSSHDITSGLVKQALSLSVKSYLDDYIKIMAIIDSDLINTTTSIPNLMILTLDWLRKLIYLYTAIQSCSNCIGGALLSNLYKFTINGDPILTQIGYKLMSDASKPINLMLTEWINSGNLNDYYYEFFISCDDTIKIEDLWSKKYTIRHTMIPSFLSSDTVINILRIGKSINFITNICGSYYKLDTDYGMLSIEANNDNSKINISSLKDIIDKINSKISENVLKLLFNEYKIDVHLDAIFRYLMLAQGDFIRQLMELLKPYLSTPAESLHLNNMTSILESAINSTNAQFDSKDILQRLDCKLAKSSIGDLGWDVFTLYYHTKGPLQVIVDQRCMNKYLRIFHFLWFVKRTVHLLDDLSKDQILYHRSFSKIIDIHPLLHKVYLIKTEMIHFISQLEYFLTFEVLECSRASFLLNLKSSNDLDSIIQAHNIFLDNVAALCFFTDDSEIIQYRLHEVFKKVVNFESLCRAIYSHCIDSQDDSISTLSNTTQFFITKINNITCSFRKCMTDFLQSLMDSKNTKHFYLAFRLDFNEFYYNSLSVVQRKRLSRQTSVLVNPRFSIQIN